MIKYRIETEDGFRETLQPPLAVKKIQLMFVCGGVEHFAHEDAQIYQDANSPKDADGNVTELLPITELETVIQTVDVVIE